MLDIAHMAQKLLEKALLARKLFKLFTKHYFRYVSN